MTMNKYRIVKVGNNQWQVRVNDGKPSYSDKTEGTLVCVCYSEKKAMRVKEALEVSTDPYIPYEC